MTRRHAFIAAAAILISVVAIFIGWQVGQKRQGSDETQMTEVLQQEILEGETVLVKLFFPGPGGRLFSEEREIPVREDLLTQLEATLDELLAGPQTEDLFPTLPPEITVDWLHLNPVGVFFVDLNFSDETPMPAWGSRQEMLAVYSLVNTVLTNTPEVTSVVLLRDGQQRPTFAGHLDTSRPLLANQQLIATP